MNRRHFLLVSGSIPLAFMLKGCVELPDKIKAPLFQSQLTIPPEIYPSSGVLNLDINSGTHQFFPEMDADTFYISGDGVPSDGYLGPTLRLRNGDDIKINFTNNLSEPTTIHGHGMHVPPEMDGTPHQTIQPGKTWTAEYTVNQVACTNWYHPHGMHKAGEHVYKGLSGLMIVDDDTLHTLDLPKTYGVDDIPLIIQDKEFDVTGGFTYAPLMPQIMRGLTGSYFLVNGVITPFISVEAKQIRFRLLNASNARVYNFSITGKSFTQIAGDGSLLESGVEMTELRLSPAERAEIIVDFTNDSEGEFILFDSDSGKPIMKINVDRDLGVATTTMPAALTTLEHHELTGLEPVHTFSLTAGMGMAMGGMSGIGGMDKNSMMKIAIDGQDARAMDMDRIDDVRVPLGEWQVWKITNDMPMTHNFHIHGTHFRVIRRWLGDIEQTVPENEKGYKDVVRIDGKGMPPMGAPAHTVELLIRQTDFASSTVPYMFHCHILEHEDAGMMGQFLVE